MKAETLESPATISPDLQPLKLVLKCETMAESAGSASRPKGTYLSHLPVKKRKMDNNFTTTASVEQTTTEVEPQVTVVSVASPLVLPVSSMTASSLLLSALTAVPKTSKSTGSTLTTGLCVNSQTGLLEPSTGVAKVLRYIPDDSQSEPGHSVDLVVVPVEAEESATSASESKPDSPERMPCAENPNFVATFCCKICQAELETYEKAQSHRFTHQVADSTTASFFVRYHCTPCHGTFDSWEEAQEHSTDSASIPLVTCNVCSNLVPANNMYDHITRHTKQTPEKLSTKLAVQVLKLQKDEENLQLTPNPNSESNNSPASSSSSLEHLPLSKKLELQTALLQADIKRFRVLRKTIKKVQKQSSSSKEPEKP